MNPNPKLPCSGNHSYITVDIMHLAEIGLRADL